MIRVESISSRIERKLLVDYIKSMHDSDSVILVPKQIGIAIYRQKSQGDGQYCRKHDNIFHDANIITKFNL